MGRPSRHSLLGAALKKPGRQPIKWRLFADGQLEQAANENFADNVLAVTARPN